MFCLEAIDCINSCVTFGENEILDKNEGSTQIASVLGVRCLGQVLQRDVGLERKGLR